MGMAGEVGVIAEQMGEAGSGMICHCRSCLSRVTGCENRQV